MNLLIITILTPKLSFIVCSEMRPVNNRYIIANMVKPLIKLILGGKAHLHPLFSF
jgi:hypothetical protein